MTAFSRTLFLAVLGCGLCLHDAAAGDDPRDGAILSSSTQRSGLAPTIKANGIANQRAVPVGVTSMGKSQLTAMRGTARSMPAAAHQAQRPANIAMPRVGGEVNKLDARELALRLPRSAVIDKSQIADIAVERVTTRPTQAQ